MPAYTDAQIAVAKTVFDVFTSKGRDLDYCATMISDFDRETSLNPHVWGDHDEAVDLAEHHKARRDWIAAHTDPSIDMTTATAEQQCEGIFFEMTNHLSPYRHVDPLLVAAATLKDKCTVIIVQYEQSANHDKDLARQLPMAEYWKAYAIAHWAASA